MTQAEPGDTSASIEHVSCFLRLARNLKDAAPDIYSSTLYSIAELLGPKGSQIATAGLKMMDNNGSNARPGLELRADPINMKARTSRLNLIGIRPRNVAAYTGSSYIALAKQMTGFKHSKRTLDAVHHKQPRHATRNKKQSRTHSADIFRRNRPARTLRCGVIVNRSCVFCLRYRACDTYVVRVAWSVDP